MTMSFARKHWAAGSRKYIEDLPTIKFTTCGVEHWNCDATLCMNSLRANSKLTYYRFSEVANCPEKRQAYSKILNKGVDFKQDLICSTHWTNTPRRHINKLPNLPCSNSYLEKKITKKTTPSGKMESAKLAHTKQPNEKVKRRRLVYKKEDSPSESEVLREEIYDLKEKLKVKTEQVNEMFTWCIELT